MKRKLLQKTACILICFFLLLPEGCGKEPSPLTKTGFYFDTVIQITIYDESKKDLLDECFSMAGRYENLFSKTKEGSDVYRINHARGAAVEVSEETIGLLETGLSYCKMSNGAFDITIGSLSDLWDFKNNTGTVPSQSEIDLAVSSVSYEEIQISGSQVRLTNHDTVLDLGGIAKGYIADRMKAYLNEQGITEGYINLGGNVLVLGPKKDGQTYRIGIQKPFDEEGRSLAAVEITDQTVVSSGVYERYFEKDGKIYHHILNPKTGYPYDNGLWSVTIICPESVDGDGLSTTCFSLGLEKGMALIEARKDTEAIFITDDLKLHLSSGIGDTIPFREIEESP